MRLEPQNDVFSDPFEETAKVQISNDQHHGEQKGNRRKIDNPQGVLRAHNARGHDQHRTDDGGPWAINLQARKLAQGEDEITGEKDDKRSQ